MVILCLWYFKRYALLEFKQKSLMPPDRRQGRNLYKSLAVLCMIARLYFILNKEVLVLYGRH